jgi:hypothetical protein
MRVVYLKSNRDEQKQITLIERLRMTEDGKKLSYSQEIHGPKRDHSFAMDFDSLTSTNGTAC